MFHRLGFVVILLLLGACASTPEPVSTKAPAASRGSSAGATPAVPATGPVSPAHQDAVQGLLDDARRLRSSGNLPASFTRLERALRIAPESAEVYLELARTHAAAGSPQRAAIVAERGLLFCEGRLCRELRSFSDS